MGKYISIRSGATALPEQSVAHLTSDLIFESGVFNKSGDSWKVVENNPQNLSVNVLAGRGYFKKSTMTYHGYSDSVVNIAINSNNSGNSRIDTVIAYVDLQMTPNSDASNILNFTAIEGLPSSSPQAPSDTEIQNAIGAGNPFIRLANILVNSGASSITNFNITDLRNEYSSYLSGVIAKEKNIILPTNLLIVPDSRTINFDLSKSRNQMVVLGGDRTLSVSNAEVGMVFLIHLKQDATGGRTVSWWSGIKWPDGVEPTLTTFADKIDTFGFIYLGNDEYLGYIVAQNL